MLEAFREGLQEQGYVEGRNVTFESRYARGRYDKTASVVGLTIAPSARLRADQIIE